MRWLKLNNNELNQVAFFVRNMTSLELLDLRGNQLTYLNETFTTELDLLYIRRRFRLDILDNPFTCDCSTVPFVRWVQNTSVQLVGRDNIMCTYEEPEVPMLNVYLPHLVERCRSPEPKDVLNVVLPIVVFVVFFGVIVVLAIQNRWYIQYAFIVCRLSGRRKHSKEDNSYDATVLYFMHATTAVDSSASREVSRWIADELRIHAEDDWGLHLHIGDRDDVAGPSKVILMAHVVVLLNKHLPNNVHLWSELISSGEFAYISNLWLRPYLTHCKMFTFVKKNCCVALCLIYSELSMVT